MNEFKHCRGRGRGTFQHNFRGSVFNNIRRANPNAYVPLLPIPHYRENKLRWQRPTHPNIWRSTPPRMPPFMRPQIPPPFVPKPPTVETRPVSPLPGSEEARQKVIAEASARIKEQLNLNENDDNCVKSNQTPVSLFNNSFSVNKYQDNCTIVNETFSDSNQMQNNKPPEKNLKKRTKKHSVTETSTSVEELRNKILTQFTYMSKGKIQNLVNNPGSSKYDGYLQHLVRDMRLHLSSELRNMYNNRECDNAENNDMIDRFNSIVPDLGIELVSLPDTMVAELSKILQFDMNNEIQIPNESSIDNTLVEPEDMFKQAEKILLNTDFLDPIFDNCEPEMENIIQQDDTRNSCNTNTFSPDSTATFIQNSPHAKQFDSLNNDPFTYKSPIFNDLPPNTNPNLQNDVLETTDMDIDEVNDTVEKETRNQIIETENLSNLDDIPLPDSNIYQDDTFPERNILKSPASYCTSSSFYKKLLETNNLLPDSTNIEPDFPTNVSVSNPVYKSYSNSPVIPRNINENSIDKTLENSAQKNFNFDSIWVNKPNLDKPEYNQNKTSFFDDVTNNSCDSTKNVSQLSVVQLTQNSDSSNSNLNQYKPNESPKTSNDESNSLKNKHDNKPVTDITVKKKKPTQIVTADESPPRNRISLDERIKMMMKMQETTVRKAPEDYSTPEEKQILKSRRKKKNWQKTKQKVKQRVREKIKVTVKLKKENTEEEKDQNKINEQSTSKHLLSLQNANYISENISTNNVNSPVLRKTEVQDNKKSVENNCKLTAEVKKTLMPTKAALKDIPPISFDSHVILEKKIENTVLDKNLSLNDVTDTKKENDIESEVIETDKIKENNETENKESKESNIQTTLKKNTPIQNNLIIKENENLPSNEKEEKGILYKIDNPEQKESENESQIKNITTTETFTENIQENNKGINHESNCKEDHHQNNVNIHVKQETEECTDENINKKIIYNLPVTNINFTNNKNNKELSEITEQNEHVQPEVLNNDTINITIESQFNENLNMSNNPKLPEDTHNSLEIENISPTETNVSKDTENSETISENITPLIETNLEMDTSSKLNEEKVSEDQNKNITENKKDHPKSKVEEQNKVNLDKHQSTKESSKKEDRSETAKSDERRKSKERAKSHERKDNKKEDSIEKIKDKHKSVEKDKYKKSKDKDKNKSTPDKNKSTPDKHVSHKEKEAKKTDNDKKNSLKSEEKVQETSKSKSKLKTDSSKELKSKTESKDVSKSSKSSTKTRKQEEAIKTSHCVHKNDDTAVFSQNKLQAIIIPKGDQEIINRLIEIDLQIQNLMQEKWTLYQQLNMKNVSNNLLNVSAIIPTIVEIQNTEESAIEKTSEVQNDNLKLRPVSTTPSESSTLSEISKKQNSSRGISLPRSESSFIELEEKEDSEEETISKRVQRKRTRAKSELNNSSIISKRLGKLVDDDSDVDLSKKLSRTVKNAKTSIIKSKKITDSDSEIEIPVKKRRKVEEKSKNKNHSEAETVLKNDILENNKIHIESLVKTDEKSYIEETANITQEIEERNVERNNSETSNINKNIHNEKETDKKIDNIGIQEYLQVKSSETIEEKKINTSDKKPQKKQKKNFKSPIVENDLEVKNKKILLKIKKSVKKKTNNKEVVEKTTNINIENIKTEKETDSKQISNNKINKRTENVTEVESILETKSKKKKKQKDELSKSGFENQINEQNLEIREHKEQEINIVLEKAKLEHSQNESINNNNIETNKEKKITEYKVKDLNVCEPEHSTKSIKLKIVKSDIPESSVPLRRSRRGTTDDKLSENSVENTKVPPITIKRKRGKKVDEEVIRSSRSRSTSKESEFRNMKNKKSDSSEEDNNDKSIIIPRRRKQLKSESETSEGSFIDEKIRIDQKINTKRKKQLSKDSDISLIDSLNEFVPNNLNFKPCFVKLERINIHSDDLNTCITADSNTTRENIDYEIMNEEDTEKREILIYLKDTVEDVTTEDKTDITPVSSQTNINEQKCVVDESEDFRGYDKSEIPQNHPISISEIDQGLFCIGHQKSILDIKIIGDEFLAASEDGTIYKYCLKTGDLQDAYTGHKRAVTCITVMSGKILDVESTIMYSGSLDCSLKCYNIDTAEILHSVTVLQAIQCMDTAWGYIFLGTYDGLLFIYNIKKKILNDQSLTIANATVLMIKATQEGSRQVLILASRKREIMVRDAFTGLLLRTMCQDQKPTIYSLLLDHSKVFCGTSDKGILILDFNNGTQTGTYNSGKGVVCMIMYKSLLFAGCYDGMIYVYNTKTQNEITKLSGPGEGMLLSLAISNDLIIAGTKKDHLLKIWKIPQEILNQIS